MNFRLHSVQDEADHISMPECFVDLAISGRLGLMRCPCHPVLEAAADKMCDGAMQRELTAGSSAVCILSSQCKNTV